MQFALCKQKVNPDTGYRLLGFGDDRQSAEPFYGDPNLWLKLCWIRSSGQNLLFVTLDTLYFSDQFTAPLYKLAKEQFSLETTDILFNASHTHSAPNISMPNWDALDLPYMESVKQAFINGLKHCRQNFRDGYISVDEIEPEQDLFISRRKKTITPFSLFKKKVERLPNRETEIDKNIRLIRLHNKNQSTAAVLYNFACHPVFNRNDQFSSDFTGAISAALEKEVEQAMFLQGFCGDIRVAFTGRRNLQTITDLLADTKHFKRNLMIVAKLLFYGEIFIPYNRHHYENYTTLIVQLIRKHMHAPHKRLNTEPGMLKQRFTATLKTETAGNERIFETTLVQFGNMLFVSIPAEPDTCFYHLLRKTCPTQQIIPMGYGAGMIAYLPGSAEVEEGGYEVDSFVFYELDSRFSSDSIAGYEKQLEQHVRKLISLNSHQSLHA